MNAKSVWQVFGALLALALLILLREVLLLIFLGVLVAVVLSFPIRLFTRLMPRGVAVLLTLALLLGGLTGLSYLGYQPITDEMNQLQGNIPHAIDRAKQWLSRAEKQAGMPGAHDQARPAGGDQLGGVLQSALSWTGQAAIGITSVALGIVVVIVLAAFFVHEPESYREGLRALVPRDKEGRFNELWDRVGNTLRHWMGGILISMTIMGAFTAAGLWIAGIPNWPLLAMLTFFGTFIPYAGAIASAVPGLLFALAESPDKFLAALVVYLAVHVVEGYIVEPMVMRRAVVIRPATLLIWQLAMGTLGGVLGIIVATPLLACVKVVVGYLYVENRLGKRSSTSPPAETKAA